MGIFDWLSKPKSNVDVLDGLNMYSQNGHIEDQAAPSRSDGQLTDSERHLDSRETHVTEHPS